MSIIHFSINDFITQLPAFAPVPAPIGEPVSQVRMRSESPASAPTSRTGVWECTQGRWQRQIRQAEFCVFLEGHARFTPADGGATLDIGAGEAVYFPANSLGEWEILEDSRKVYLIFEEGAAA